MTDLHHLLSSSLGKSTFLISAFLPTHNYLLDCFILFLFPAFQKDAPKSATVTLPFHESSHFTSLIPHQVHVSPYYFQISPYA